MLESRDLIRISQNLMRELLKPQIDLMRFFQYVLDQTLDVLEFDVGWMLLKEGDWLRIVAADRLHSDDVGRTFLITDCLSGLSMLHKGPINVPDLTVMPEEWQRIYKAPTGKGMQSELVIPLLIGDEAIGAFNIESHRKNAFTTHHVEALSLLSGQVAAAIALARSRQEAAALSSVGLDLSRQTDLDEVLRSVLTHALTLVQGRFGQVLLRYGEVLTVRFTTNQPPEDLNLTVDIQDSICGLAIQHLKPVIVPDVTRPDYLVVYTRVSETSWAGELIPYRTERPRYKRALEADKASICAEFAVPVYYEGSIIGILNVETPRLYGFNDEQRERLLALIENRSRHLAEALDRLDRARLLELLREALACVDTSFGQVLRPEGDDLVIEQTTGNERVGTRVSLYHSVTGRALRTGAPVYVPDVACDPDYQRYLGEEMKSELAVPLIIGDEALGVLNIESAVLGAFTVDHARILEAFANQAAVAIDRARRFESQKLAELGGLAGDIVHRLNNPLGAISMQIDLFKRKIFYQQLLMQYPYVERFLERIEADLDSAKATIRELRSALNAPAPPLRGMPLVEAIRQGLARVGMPETLQLQLSFPEEEVYVMAHERLPNVFWNLFDNARKAMPQGGTLCVRVDPVVDPGWVVVQIQDSGHGIEPWRVDSIFEPGEATPSDPYAPAHGLGLWWTRMQVERFGGTITVASTPGVGTQVTIRLRKSGERN
ncbi:MAG: GAF domain-containing protein [Anaerolineae bacterium]